MRRYWKWALLFAYAAMMVSLLGVIVSAAVRETNVTEPDEGNSIVEVPGIFTKANVGEVLALVNSYRREACQKGYPNPYDPEVRLTMDDYSEVKWSGDLEWIAQTRAAEGTVLQDHTRPNGKSCFDISYHDTYSASETLAWNYGSLIGGIKQWYEEKEDWINQNANAVTGHYTAMISPSLKYIGIGCFTSDSGGWSCIAGAYSRNTDLDETQNAVSGRWNQKMEVLTSSITAPAISGSNSVVSEKTVKLSFERFVVYPGIWGGSIKTPIFDARPVTWTVSDPAVASVSADGAVTGLKPGKVTISAQQENETATFVMTVVAPAKGTILNTIDASYKVTKQAKELQYQKYKGKTAKAAVPAAVTIGGVNYQVISIGASAFKGSAISSVTIGKNVQTIGNSAFQNCVKLKAVTVPAAVTKIGKKAFYGCKKLKKVTIKSRKLKAGKIGNKVFSKAGIKTVKVPKGKKAAYQKLLSRAGLSRTAKVK